MDPITMMALAAAGSGAATKLFNPGKGYKKAQEQQEKYYNQGQQYLQPYNEHGQEAYGHLNTAMQNLLNPTQQYDQWMEAYQPSKAAQFAQGRNQDAGLSAASAMGLSGSTPALQAMQSGNAEIGAQDEQRYIDRMIQQYMQGANLAQGIYGQGAGAADAQAGNAMNMGTNSGQNAFGRQNAGGEMFSNLFGTAMGAGMGGNKWSTNGNQGAPLRGYNQAGSGY